MIEQSPNPPKSTSKTASHIVGIIIVFIVAVISGIIGRQSVKSISDRSPLKPHIHSSPTNDWATRNFGNLSLNAPFKFVRNLNIEAQIPRQVRDATDYFEAFDSGNSTNPEILVSRIKCKAGIQCNLDGAMNGGMNGAIKSIAAAARDTNPKFNSNAISIDGLPARRASYNTHIQGTSIRLEAVFVEKGQKIWQVQAICRGNLSFADAKRILDSIHIKTTP